MAIEEQDPFLSGAESVGSSSERALNDVALSIGFSMMVLLLVVVSSMTALQNIMVNLPQAKPEAEEEAGPSAKSVTVVVTLEAGTDGSLQGVYADGRTVDPNGQPLGVLLANQYAEDLEGVSAVSLEIRADSSLSHGTVTESLDRFRKALSSIGGVSRKVTVSIVSAASQTD